jgi:hypothetical protein
MLLLWRISMELVGELWCIDSLVVHGVPSVESPVPAESVMR